MAKIPKENPFNTHERNYMKIYAGMIVINIA